jgi:hypothetical protein
MPANSSAPSADQVPGADVEVDDCTDDAEAADAVDEQAAMVGRIIDRRLGQVLRHARDTDRLADLHAMISRAVDQLRDHLADRHPCRGATGETHGHPGYRPPTALRQLIHQRHTTCTFPSCNQPARRCDLDHTIPWQPGATCHCNLAPLCRRHHRSKQSPGWKLVQPWPGLLVWITPAGTWHITLPNRN